MTTGNDRLVEKKRWYRNTSAILGLITALAGAVGGVYATVQYVVPLFFAKSISDWNVAIVLDRSAAMAQPFDGGTKWDAVIQALDSKMEPIGDGDNLALRTFGGPCRGKNTELLVGFDHGNKEVVRSRLRSLKPAGETSLTDAMIAAIGDFNDPERFAGRNKSIIVITGGEQFCSDAPAEAIRKRLSKQISNDQPIELEFRYIGVGIPAPLQEELIRVAEDTGGTAHFPETTEEIEQELGDHIDAAVADYAWDFRDPVGPEWSLQRTEVSRKGARSFLGRFVNDKVTLTLGNLRDHSKLTVSFDLLILDSWDGNNNSYGPDVWSLAVDDEEVMRTTFANVNGARQAYPDEAGGDHPARSGAREQDTLGYDFYGNTVYRIVRTVAHDKDSATVTFAASNLQGVADESWGLGKVTINLTSRENVVTERDD